MSYPRSTTKKLEQLPVFIINSDTSNASNEICEPALSTSNQNNLLDMEKIDEMENRFLTSVIDADLSLTSEMSINLKESIKSDESVEIDSFCIERLKITLMHHESQIESLISQNRALSIAYKLNRSWTSLHIEALLKQVETSKLELSELREEIQSLKHSNTIKSKQENKDIIVFKRNICIDLNSPKMGLDDSRAHSMRLSSNREYKDPFD